MLVRSYLNISVSIFLPLLSSLLFFFLIILIFFSFFFLFIPFFSLQELLCALRVKSRLRHGGWLVGWLVGLFSQTLSNVYRFSVNPLLEEMSRTFQEF